MYGLRKKRKNEPDTDDGRYGHTACYRDIYESYITEYDISVVILKRGSTKKEHTVKQVI